MSIVLPPGEHVDRYEVLGLLGEGGMASVYLVRHGKLGSEHVLKVLTTGGRALAERLMEEGRVQATLRHPNVVEVTDVVEVHGAPGLIMRYVRGPSLEDLLRHRPLSLDEVQLLVPRILAGVQAAHELGFVHRDLKPANVLLSLEKGGVMPMVADFGLVKRAEGGSKTRTGTTMGTPHYLAPEQIRGAENADTRADIWSLGAMVQELLTGERVFDADSVFDILTKVSNREFLSIDELRPDLPVGVREALRGALQPLDERWPTVERFWEVWSDGGPSLHVASAGPAPWDLDELQPLVPSRPSPTPSPVSTPATYLPSEAALATPATWTDDAPDPLDEPTRAAGSDEAITTAGAVAPLPSLPPLPTSPPDELPAQPGRTTVLQVLSTLTGIAVGMGSVGGVIGLGVWMLGGAPTVPATPPTPQLVVPAPLPPSPAVERPAPVEPPALPKPEDFDNLPAPPPATPEPAPPSPAAPKPAPEPDADMGTWSFHWQGDPGTGAVLVGPAGRFAPGPVPAGDYALTTTFAPGDEATFDVHVDGGQHLATTCVRSLRSCTSAAR